MRPFLRLFALTLSLLAGAVLAQDCVDTGPTPLERVQPTRFGQGLLWRVSSPAGGVSHLYGTMHVDFPEVTQLPPVAALRFAGAKTLAVEVVLDEAAQAAYSNAMQLPPEATGQRTALAPTLAERYFTMSRGLGVPEVLADRLKAWAAVNLIGRPPPRRDGIPLDELLQQRALASGKTVLGLETMPELLATLDGIAEADHRAVLEDALCQVDHLEAEVGIMVQLYLAGDLDSLYHRARSEPGPDGAFQRHWQALLDQRNQRFLAALRPLLDQGDNFIAIGALHLPGEAGLLQGLEAAGYAVEAEPVLPSVSAHNPAPCINGVGSCPVALMSRLP